MKIALRDLRANPYRRIDHYPMQHEKIDGLIESIKTTEFWDNIVVRKSTFKKGEFEIAYGHHRLAALRKTFRPEHEVDLPVRKISDERMLQIMARENSDTWKADASVMAETVHAALEAFAGGETPHLKGSRKGKTLSAFGVECPNGDIGIPTLRDLATFLAMTHHDVDTALDILALSARVPDEIQPKTFAGKREGNVREHIAHDKKLGKTKLSPKARDRETVAFVKKHVAKGSTKAEIKADSDRIIKQTVIKETKAERPAGRVASSIQTEINAFLRHTGDQYKTIEALAACYTELDDRAKKKCDALTEALVAAGDRVGDLVAVLTQGRKGKLGKVTPAQQKRLEVYEHD